MGVVEVLDPVLPMKTGGEEVDVSRGERNRRVSSEWFNRPETSGICRSTICEPR